MKPLCEVIVKEVLPAARSILAQELLNAGLTQKEVAKKLQLTQPSVSHYLKNVRGRNVQILQRNGKINRLLKKTAKQIKNKKSTDLMVAFCEVCKDIRRTKLVCKFHRDIVSGLSSCNICLKGNVCGV
jgi:predicted transcriptional regulator